MNKIVIATLFLFLSQFGYAQQATDTHKIDSTLVKMVRGLQQVVKNRAKDVNYSDKVMKGWPDQVSVQGIMGGVYIDSLAYHYDIDAFKSIRIDFDFPLPIGGSEANFGYITLCRKGDQAIIPRGWSTYPYGQTKGQPLPNTLYKMVRQIQQLIVDRARDAGYPDRLIEEWPDRVLLEGTGEWVPVDSVARYDISDFRLIQIYLDRSPSVSGPKAPYGLIALLRKDDLDKPKIKNRFQVK